MIVLHLTNITILFELNITVTARVQQEHSDM